LEETKRGVNYLPLGGDKEGGELSPPLGETKRGDL